MKLFYYKAAILLLKLRCSCLVLSKHLTLSIKVFVIVSEGIFSHYWMRFIKIVMPDLFLHTLFIKVLKKILWRVHIQKRSVEVCSYSYVKKIYLIFLTTNSNNVTKRPCFDLIKRYWQRFSFILQFDRDIFGKTGNVKHMLQYRKEVSDLAVKRLQDVSKSIY